MSRHQIAICHHMRLKVIGLGVRAAVLLQHVFDEVRHHFGQSDRRFFRVGESGDLLPANERRAIGCLGVPKDSRAMANSCHGLACRKHGFDQGNGCSIFGHVPHDPVAADVENRIIVVGGDGG